MGEKEKRICIKKGKVESKRYTHTYVVDLEGSMAAATTTTTIKRILNSLLRIGPLMIRAPWVHHYVSEKQRSMDEDGFFLAYLLTYITYIRCMGNCFHVNNVNVILNYNPKSWNLTI